MPHTDYYDDDEFHLLGGWHLWGAIVVVFIIFYCVCGRRITTWYYPPEPRHSRRGSGGESLHALEDEDSLPLLSTRSVSTRA